MEAEASPFPDHFSSHADLYRRFRPTYPEALYRWLAGLVDRRRRVWDCATGNGQAAVGLAAGFRQVVGTDASIRQLRHARPHGAVSYVAALAERSPFPPGSFDLVAVAQAVHWFRHDAFWAEVRRVLRPGGVIAVWTYELFSLDEGADAAPGPDEGAAAPPGGAGRPPGHPLPGRPGVDDVMAWFYSEVVGPHWPPERRWIEEGYRTLPFPFEEIAPVPDFVMRPRWGREDILGQVSTWSAVRRYREASGSDPLELLRPRLAEAWPDGAEEREVRWPLRLRVGRV